jgi:hypothetical protein
MKTLAICILCFGLIVFAGSAFAQPQLVTSLVKDLGLDSLLGKVFDKLLADKTPQEAARPKVRELYASLLEVREKRETLSQTIDQRIKILGSSTDAKERKDSRSSVVSSASDAKASFVRLQKAFKNLNVDIDAKNPALSSDLEKFSNEQRPIYVTTQIDVDNVKDLGIALEQLRKNQPNLESALNKLRELTRKVYPDFGDLLSPGLFR